MQSDDKPVNGQPNFPDTLGQTPPPPDAKDQPRTQRTARLRKAWEASWKQGGFLHARWEDLRRAPDLGWHGMADWMKATIALAGLCVVIMLLDGAASVLTDALHELLHAVPRVQVGADTSTGVFAVVDQPIRSYIAAHSPALPISASTIYTVWQLAGLFGLVGGFFRSSGARITWTAWGASSIAMVHSATPADSRTIATGLAALAWTAASVLALRGLTLRPSLFIHNATPGISLRPEIHIPAQATPPAGDAPDNVHPFHQR